MAKRTRTAKVVKQNNQGMKMPESQDTGIVTNVGKMPNNVELAIVAYIKQCYGSSDIDDRRSRFSAIDRAYSHEPLAQTDEEKRQAVLDDTFTYTIPIVKPDVEAARDYLVQTFLSANQLLTVVAGPDQEAERQQMQAVINESVNVFKTQQELGKVISQLVRYNFGATEVNWECKVSKEVVNSGDTGAEAAIDVVTFAGNNIKQLDPYNVFYDTQVAVDKISEDADFIGYVERYSMLQLYKLLSDFKTSQREVNHETMAMYRSVPADNWYYTPDIVKNRVRIGNPAISSWADYWGSAFNVDGSQSSGKSYYEVTTVYLRIIPAMLGWTSCPMPTDLQLWRFVLVNGQFIINAEKVSNPHNYLNILITVPDISGLGVQAKSLAENLMPYQTLTSELWEIRRAVLYRSVGDRGIYDPKLINKSDIESKNPRAKIPIKAGVRGAKPNEAYYPIPFRDDTANSLHTEMASIRQHANEIAGTNNTTRGQFQKGNKTRYEYQDVQQNAVSGQAVMALIIEAQLFVPLKQIVKMNILLNQGAAELYDSKAKTTVDVNPVDLRNAALAFKVADGVATTKTIINTDALREAFMFISQSPQFQMEYDVGKLMAHMLSLDNADLSDYKRTPQEQQQFMQQTQSVTAANNPQQPQGAPNGQ